MNLPSLAVTALGIAMLGAGCTQSGHLSPEAKCIGGTVAGAAAGGLLGNQVGGGTGKTLATVAGAGAGGYVGNRIGCQ